MSGSIIDVITLDAIRPILDNEYWQAFGFRRRPKRGALFNSLVPRKRFRLERFLIRESVPSHLALWAHASKLEGGGGVDDDRIRGAIRQISTGPGVPGVLGYEGAAACEEGIGLSLLDYRPGVEAEDLDSWTKTFISHAGDLERESLLRVMLGLAHMTGAEDFVAGAREQLRSNEEGVT